jgi:hypothetical protein
MIECPRMRPRSSCTLLADCQERRFPSGMEWNRVANGCWLVLKQSLNLIVDSARQSTTCISITESSWWMTSATIKSKVLIVCALLLYYR